MLSIKTNLLLIQKIMCFSNTLDEKFYMMMKNYDELVEINQNPNGPYIINYPYRSLNIGYSGSGKTNVLPNLITKNQ